jgi:phenylalanyl-tRNA synthetase beta chain
MEGYGLEKKAYVVEIYIETLLPLIFREKQFKPLAKFPSVRRDISIIVNRSIESAMLISIVKEIGKGLVESVDIFDIYQGKQIVPQEKALALGISYRSKERTLTDDEVNRIHEEIIEEIRRQTGGRLREGPKNGNTG